MARAAGHDPGAGGAARARRLLAAAAPSSRTGRMPRRRRAETVDIPQTVTQLAARHDADGRSASRCCGCSTSATARCANSRCRPGQAVRVGDVIVRLRACETTAPWEVQQLTGAFVQLDVREPATEQFRRVFSGWLYKETPSLNVVEHPIYDVWPKSCAMTHPGGGTPAPVGRAPASSRSSASNSTGPAAERRRAAPRRAAPAARARNPTAPDSPSGRSRPRRGWRGAAS